MSGNYVSLDITGKTEHTCLYTHVIIIQSFLSSFLR